MNRTARSIAAAGLLLACFWLAPLGVQPAASAPSEPEVLARVGFGQGVYNVTVGDDFTVAIVVDDADALGGWEAALTYDPAVVRPAGLAAGAFLASTGRAAALLGPDGDPGSGPVALGGYSWDPTGGIPNGVSGDGELAQVALHAVAVGGSVLNLAGPVFASVQGASVTTQAVEPHSAQVNVYAAPAAPAATASRSGNDIRIAWQHAPTNTNYQVWRSAYPYFTPGEGDSIAIAGGLPPAPNCEMVGGVIKCSDPAVLATPGRYFYVVLGLNPAGAKAPSARLGAFVVPLSPGQ